MSLHWFRKHPINAARLWVGCPLVRFALIYLALIAMYKKTGNTLKRIAVTEDGWLHVEWLVPQLSHALRPARMAGRLFDSDMIIA